MPSPALLSDLCHRELELCRVHPGEAVAVLSQGDDRADYAEAFLAAIVRLGATGFHVRVPESTSGLTNEGGAWRVGVTPLSAQPAVVDALKTVDMVVDLIFLLFSREQLEIQQAGTRILTCVEPVPVLTHLFPLEERRAVAEAAVERLRSARELRFTNAHGTDVTYRLGAYPVQCQYGFTDEPGRWDHWPSGAFVYTGGHDEGVDGRVVIAPGDILLPFKRFVEEPITLTIEGGRITAIEGGNDAEVMRDYMAGFDDERAYALSHIGWGLEPRARWSGLATDPGGMWMEARCFAGNVLFSTGPNQELGGANDTPCHLDIPMRHCDLFLDGEAVVHGGSLVDGTGDRGA
jgi:2,5-dihydroxypyridine 5,6-dioxygenase